MTWIACVLLVFQEVIVYDFYHWLDNEWLFLIKRKYARIQSLLRSIADKFIAGFSDLTVAVVVFAVFGLLWLLLRWMLATAFRRTHGDATTAAFAQTVLKLAILAIDASAALDFAGIKTCAVLTSLGLVGLTVSFAAKDTLSNFISGLM